MNREIDSNKYVDLSVEDILDSFNCYDRSANEYVFISGSSYSNMIILFRPSFINCCSGSKNQSVLKIRVQSFPLTDEHGVVLVTIRAVFV